MYTSSNSVYLCPPHYSHCVMIVTCFCLPRRDLGLNSSDTPSRLCVADQPLGGRMHWDRISFYLTARLREPALAQSLLWTRSACWLLQFSPLPGECGCEHSPAAHLMRALDIVIGS